MSNMPLFPSRRASAASIGLILGCLAWNLSQAATITVNTGAAATEGDPTDNQCDILEALEAANTDTASGNLLTHPEECAAGDGSDTIVLLTGVTVPTTPALEITDSVVIMGAPGSRKNINGIISQRNPNITVRGTDTAPIAGVRFENLAFLNGGSSDTSVVGAIWAEYADISFHNVRFASNRGERSGGIYANNASILLEDCEFDTNIAVWDGGAIWLDTAEVVIDNCYFYQNIGKGEMRHGGDAIMTSAVSDNALTIRHSLFEANRAGDISNQERDGGALYIDGGTVNISDTTFSSNISWDDGAAMYIAGGDVTITNSTFTKNHAGLFGNDESQDPQGGALGSGDGNLYGHSGLTLAQSLVGVLVGGGEITATADGSTPTPLGDILDDDLLDNVGDWSTHALVEDSPALDAASQAFCTASDQRQLFFRADGGLCDIGAFEIKREDCHVARQSGRNTLILCL